MLRFLFSMLLGFVMFTSSTTAHAADYGKPITLKEITAVSAILDKPENFIGKRVLVKGLVVDVCSARGCWLDIASDRKFEKIQIKVTDGDIVFPMSARGKTALVEGVVEELKLSRDETVKYYKHKAEEKGLPFDPASVKGPESIYRIKGVGAVIQD